MTDSEARSLNIVPLSRKAGTRVTTLNAQSWRSVYNKTVWSCRENYSIFYTADNYYAVLSLAIPRACTLHRVISGFLNSKSAGFPVHYSARSAQQCSVTCSAHKKYEYNILCTIFLVDFSSVH